MGSLFDRHKIIHGLPEPGQKVCYNKPTKWAFFNEVLENEKLLTLGECYTVKKTELNSSSTYIWLEEFWDDVIDEHLDHQKFFNMHAFIWDIPKLDLAKLVGLDIYSASRINHTYDYGIKFDGELYVDGYPVVVLEHVNNIVTNAYYEENV